MMDIASLNIRDRLPSYVIEDFSQHIYHTIIQLSES